jgi:hypothetical protein
VVAGSGVANRVTELVGVAIVLLGALQLIAFVVVRRVRSQRCPRCGKRFSAGLQDCDCDER